MEEIKEELKDKYKESVLNILIKKYSKTSLPQHQASNLA